ncbi:hypothetical protein [Microvirga arabica]|uniref:hypothetical protein n=1 Tax=Microvirga arabica TaxID=1128671 RepID=UPI00361D35C5
MRTWQKSVLAAAAVCVMAAVPALAQGKGNGPGGSGPPGLGGGGPPGLSKGNKGAPGPIAGAGLPFLLIAGGYALVRRYRNRSRTEQAS